jgi:protein-S-isoprenylcysteine O-methyltransferase Ste14
MSRVFYLAVAIVCYLAFFVAFVYLVGFVGAFPFMPSSVDKGITGPANIALAIDIGVIAVFGLQHSVMAREGFKAGWTRIVPSPIERSVYCLATSAALALMFVLWHPIAGSVWTVTTPPARIALWALFALGWAILFVATHLINHWELFGLEQAWRYFRRQDAKPPELRQPLFYKAVRHPIYSGILLAIWATPAMTYGHLLLALGFTIYILIGVRYEEKDLVGNYGAAYVEYRRKVGMVIPWVGRGG